MAPIVTTAEIGRPVEEVFACATDPARFKEWQKGVVDGHMDGPEGWPLYLDRYAALLKDGA